MPLLRALWFVLCALCVPRFGRGRFAFDLLIFLVLVSPSHAARADVSSAPTLDHVYPVAVQAGTTSEITAVGKFAPWPPQVWIDAPGISFHAEKATGKYSVEVGADAPIGPHLIRIFNETGASAPRFLIVSANQE